jgi:Skp family chaperone for outer membrane proteins
VQVILQLLPGVAAVLTAMAAVIGALWSARVGQAMIAAKEEQIKVKDEQIALLERLTPARIVEHLEGYRKSYESLLERARDELADAETQLKEATEVGSAGQAERDRLQEERQDLLRIQRQLQRRLSEAEEALRVVMPAVQIDQQILSVLTEPDIMLRVGDVLQRDGNTVTVPGGGGPDLLADKDGVRTAVEIKRSGRTIDTSTVRQVQAMMAAWRAQRGLIVMAGVGQFSRASREEASRSDIELWDASTLIARLSERDENPGRDL